MTSEATRQLKAMAAPDEVQALGPYVCPLSWFFCAKVISFILSVAEHFR